MNTLNADQAAFFRFNLPQDDLRFELGLGFDAESLAALQDFHFQAKDENQPVGWVSNNALPLNLAEPSPLSIGPKVDSRIYSELYIPIQHDLILIGVHAVFSPRKKAFSRQTEQMLLLFANQAAVAIRNAYLIIETRRRLINIPDLRGRDTGYLRSPNFSAEKFVAYYAIPLSAKDEVMGVLEIFHRSPLNPDPEWLSFLETLAGQAAIAINNTQLFDSLKSANLELALAYNKTIEGWSMALDLRDKETEGHTLRVTEMIQALAWEMGINQEELVQIRRGSLLHNIGKLGVPDTILLKPGPLTDDEWILMKKHPTCAYEMITPIDFLNPVIYIPYCHHEKWDGSGYPRGLKGEDIPISARIFAIVDVWDALTSDRPYRKAWTKETALQHIIDQSSKHFDPQVVEAFISFYKKKSGTLDS